MRLIIAILATALLASCGSKPAADKPDVKEVVGVWECSDFPSGFLTNVGVAVGSRTSQIVILKDGTCSASNFPQRSPYRFTNVASSSWTLTDPSMTPSGAWSVEFDANFLQCRRNGGELEFRYLISGKDEYHVTYKRTEQVAGADR